MQIGGKNIATNSPFDIAGLCRVIIFWDMTGDTATATPKLSEVFEIPSTILQNNCMRALRFRNCQDASNTTRYKMLKDKIFFLNNNDYTNPIVPFMRTIKMDLKMRHCVEYYGAGAGTANKGAIYMFVLYMGATTGKGVPSLDYIWRLKWKDKLF
jgi:hypothetical protein